MKQAQHAAVVSLLSGRRLQKTDIATILCTHGLYLLNSAQFNTSSSTLTPKVTSGKKLPQCSEHVFKHKHFQFTLENVVS